MVGMSDVEVSQGSAPSVMASFGVQNSSLESDRNHFHLWYSRAKQHRRYGRILPLGLEI